MYRKAGRRDRDTVRGPEIKYWSTLGAAALIALIASTYVKASLLGSREPWLDETYSAFVASLPFRDLLHFVSGDVHPKLFSILLWLWVQMVSNTQSSLRLFSVIVNALSVVAMFLVGRKTLRFYWGSFATVLFAISPILLFYSLEVRSYMLLVLVSLCATLMHWRISVEGDDGLSPLMAYGVLLALMFYVHYLGIFIGVGLLCHWLVHVDRSIAQSKKVILSYVVATLLIAPGLPLMVSQHRLKVNLDRQLLASHQEPNTLSFNSQRTSPPPPEIWQ